MGRSHEVRSKGDDMDETWAVFSVLMAMMVLVLIVQEWK